LFNSKLNGRKLGFDNPLRQCSYSVMESSTKTSSMSTLFIRTILEEHETHFCSKCKNKLRTIAASAEEQILKFSI